MGLFSGIFSTSVATPIEAIGSAVDKIFTSDEERLQAQAVLEKLRQHPAELQVELNKIEAQHRSIFVSGARPFLMWICDVSIGLYFIPQFILGSYMWFKMSLAAGAILPYPVSGKYLFDLVIAMLGLGALRTAEKFGGKTK